MKSPIKKFKTQPLNGVGLWCITAVAFKSGYFNAGNETVFSDIKAKAALALIVGHLHSKAVSIAHELEKQEFEFAFSDLPQLEQPGVPNAKVLPFIKPKLAPVPHAAVLNPNAPAKPDFSALLGSTTPIRNLTAPRSHHPWNNKNRIEAFASRMHAEWPRDELGRELLALRLPSRAFAAVTDNSLLFTFDAVNSNAAVAHCIDDVVPETVFQSLRNKP